VLGACSARVEELARHLRVAATSIADIGRYAENQLYLSRAVLAFALGCDEGALDRGPLRVLRQEAMVDGGTSYVLTRHRKIAESRAELADRKRL